MFLKRFFIAVVSTFAFFASPLAAQEFREGVLAFPTSNGSPSFAFAFVVCNGGLMFDFHADEELNAFRSKTSDGGYVVNYNNGQYTFTLYSDGRAVKPDGTVIQYRHATSSELTGSRAGHLDAAKSKCG